MRKLLCGLIVALTLFMPCTYAHNKYTSSRITSLDGLSQNDVSQIIQDSYGFMWIATNDGLCRYDGYDFKIFSIGDSGLDTNLILSIVEDRNSNIWIGTADKGVYCYQRNTGRFVRYSEITDTPTVSPLHAIRELTLTDDDTLWCYDIVGKAIVRLNLDCQRDRITSVDLYPQSVGDIPPPSKIFVYGSVVYFGTNEGLYRFDESDNSIVDVDCGVALGGVSDISQSGAVLHLATSIGLVSYNPVDNTVKRHELGVDIINIYLQNDLLWVATRNGIYTFEYNSRDDSFGASELVEPYKEYSINGIAEDHTGGIWVGFHKVGIRRYQANRRPFMTNKGFGNDHVFSIFSTPQREVWVGTERGGIFVLDSIGGLSKGSALLPQSTIYSMDYASINHSIYVATNNGLMKLKEEGGRYLAPEISFPNISVRKVLVDGNFLWIMLHNKSIIRQNLLDGSSVNISQLSQLPSHIIRDMMLDRKGNIWFCTSNGITKIAGEQRLRPNPKIDAILPDSIGNHYAVTMIEDHRGDIWYGTMGYGLYRLREVDGQGSNGEQYRYDMMHITRNDGLSSNVVRSIIEDDNGVVWVSTNRGVSAVKCIEGKMNINSYDIHDGLQGYEFNELSVAKMSDGTIALGGVAGYNYFNPDNFVADTTQIRPVVTDFLLMGESIMKRDDLLSIAPGGLYDKRGVTLSYDQNNFTIKFSGIHYSNPSKNQYKYRLEGVDRNWITRLGGIREVNYRDLAPGSYTFYLNAANADGVWASENLELHININPPFWMMWYAYILYVLLFVIIAYYVMRNIRNVMRRRNEVALAEMERVKMQEMLDMRTRFFTNISHEFRTPLTLILTPLQRLLGDEQIAKNPKWRAQLNTMSHNGDSLMRLINEFLSYTKHESGALKAQLVPSKFVSLVNRLFEQFGFWADQRGIQLNYNAPSGEIVVDLDQYLIEQVIYNLMSNAIKFTPEGGEVSLDIELGEGCVVLSISDTGCGISEQMRPHIFEKFFSSASNASKEIGGTGIGLFLTKSLVVLHGGEIWFTSIDGGGTTFFVKLPKSRSVSLIEGVFDDPNVESESHEVNVVDTLEADGDKEESVANRPTILIVDDNIDILQLLSELFDEKYKVLTAKDGEEGWDKCSKQLPDIIISDVMMPKLNGLDLCDRVKGDASTSHIPVVLLSAKSSNEDIAAGLRCSADAYCPKPFNNSVLLGTVDSILVNRRRLADKFSAMRLDDNCEPLFANYGDDATTNTDKVFLKRITEYIEENIHTPDLVVSDLCNHMGITPLALNKKLKSLVNMTANALIRTIRLRRAAALLKTARYTIADVTYDVGFSDLRYFRECFKKEFGVLPQEYKDRYLNGDVVESRQPQSVEEAIIDAAATRSVIVDEESE